MEIKSVRIVEYREHRPNWQEMKAREIQLAKWATKAANECLRDTCESEYEARVILYPRQRV